MGVGCRHGQNGMDSGQVTAWRGQGTGRGRRGMGTGRGDGAGQWTPTGRVARGVSMNPVLPPPPSVQCPRPHTSKGSGRGPGRSPCGPPPAPPLPPRPLQRLWPPAAALGQRPAPCARPGGRRAPDACVRAPRVSLRAPSGDQGAGGCGFARSSFREQPPSPDGKQASPSFPRRPSRLFADELNLVISAHLRSLSAFCAPSTRRMQAEAPAASRVCPVQAPPPSGCNFLGSDSLCSWGDLLREDPPSFLSE